MSFLAYFVALIITVGSVLFGLDVIVAPVPNHKRAVPLISVPSAPNKLAKREAERAEHDVVANKMLTPVYPAKPGLAGSSPPPTETTGSAPPEKVTEMVPAAGNQGKQSASQTADVSAPSQKPAATANTTLVQPQSSNPAPLPQQVVQGLAQKTAGNCNIEACANAYRSFRASDCSYQPFEGSRRACVAPQGTQARNDPASGLRSGRTARAIMTRAPRYEELRSRDDEDDDAAGATMDDDGGRGIFFAYPRGWFR